MPTQDGHTSRPARVASASPGTATSNKGVAEANLGREDQNNSSFRTHSAGRGGGGGGGFCISIKRDRSIFKGTYACTVNQPTQIKHTQYQDS